MSLIKIKKKFDELAKLSVVQRDKISRLWKEILTLHNKHGVKKIYIVTENFLRAHCHILDRKSFEKLLNVLHKSTHIQWRKKEDKKTDEEKKGAA